MGKGKILEMEILQNNIRKQLIINTYENSSPRRYAANPGDLSWDELKSLGECTVYDRTAPAERA